MLDTSLISIYFHAYKRVNRSFQQSQQDKGKETKALDPSGMKVLVFPHLASNQDQLKYWMRVGNFNKCIRRVPEGKNKQNQYLEGQYLNENSPLIHDEKHETTASGSIQKMNKKKSTMIHKEDKERKHC